MPRLKLGAVMRRREFIILVGSVAAWPPTARGQQSNQMRRIGVLLGSYTESDKAGQARIAAFLKSLADLGWNTDRNIRIEYRWAASDTEQTKKLILETVQSAPDAIVATSDPVLAQLHGLTSTLPIIFTQISEPVETGLVASLARPGGNMTGFQNFESAIGGKWLGVLKEMAPNLKRVGALFMPDAKAHASFLDAAKQVAPSAGITVAIVDIQTDIESAIASYADQPDSGLIVFPHPKTIANRKLISSLAARHHLPAIYPYRYFAADGGLITYGPNQIDQWRGAAIYVDRILKGEKPADLPVQTPTKYELAINLKTAKTLGLTVASSLIARADEVIE
jgi:putative tryptophan/tyrosine transport system substrate-binding protein